MTSDEIAWVAGLFEGEGSFFINTIRKRGKVYTYPCAAVQMTDEDVVRRLHSLVGLGTVNGPSKKPKAHWKPGWIWRINGREETLTFFRMIEPWLCSRRLETARKVLGL